MSRHDQYSGAGGLKAYAGAQGAALNSGPMTDIRNAVGALEANVQTWNTTIAGDYTQGGRSFELRAVGGSDRVTVQGVTVAGVPWSAQVRYDRLTGANPFTAILQAGKAQGSIPKGVSRQDIEDSDVGLEIDWDEIYRT